MGYELHITRAEDWSESDQQHISAQEWLAVVSSDPGLGIDEENGPYCAVWSGRWSYPDGGWFDWREGSISTKNPDRAILGKMLELAAKLNAKVQGDDGEAYTDVAQLSEGKSSQSAWLTWRNLVEYAKVVLILLLLGLLLSGVVFWLAW